MRPSKRFERPVTLSKRFDNPSEWSQEVIAQMSAGDGTFHDGRLPVSDRVADLLHRLTLAEKVALLHQYQAPIPRLGIGPFHTGTEVLHGLAWLGPATVFPQAVGLASTWNPELVRRVGEAVGDEARGFHHKDPSRGGLNVWAPVVNLLRDPRWGRNEEGYAEDPLLTGVLATAYAQGLRGDHPKFLKTAPTLKHFLAYNNETRRDTTSSNLPPRVLREYELPAFRAPIEAGAAVAVMASYNLVNGRPAHLSPLINSTLRRWSADDLLVVSDAQAPSNVASRQHYYPDHVASHAALLRAGVDSFTDNDDRSELTAERVGEALSRGLLSESDVDNAVRHLLSIRFRLGEFDPPEENPYAAITEEVINCPAHQALAGEVARQAMVLLKNDRHALPLHPQGVRRVAVLGPLADTLYEDWYSGTLPYALTARRGIQDRLGDRATVRFVEGLDRVALRVAPSNRGLAGRYVAADGTEQGGPLRADADTSHPGTWLDVADWGRGTLTLRSVSNGRYLTVGDQCTGVVNESLAPGGWVVRETFELRDRLGSEVVIRHLGSGAYVVVEADGVLRASAQGPAEATGFTVELLSDGVTDAVAAAAEADVAIVLVGNHPLINGRETQDRVDLALPAPQDRLIRAVYATNPRTVLVVTSSYPYAIDWAQEHVPAILWSAHGGQEFGCALAGVLFGDTAPAGRLTQTWYRSAADLPDLLDYDIIDSDATYLYYRGTPLYPFGHGLTYTPVEYGDLNLSATEIAPDGELRLRVEVRNTGNRTTDEVVQVYTRQHRSRVKQPVRALRGFQRVTVHPGQQTAVEFRIAAADLAFWDVTRGRYAVEAATHTVMVGRSSEDVRCCATFTVAGEQIPPRDAAGRPLPAADFDGYAGVTLTDASPDGGDAVSATEAGGWIAFEGVDFGAGVATCVASLSRTGTGPAGLTLRLDDPLAGPVIATVTGACTGGRHTWAQVPARISGATGVRDLYAVFDAAGVNLRTLSFVSPPPPDQPGEDARAR
jgi:beta-glucosidase